jgi:hypothetical protein
MYAIEPTAYSHNKNIMELFQSLISVQIMGQLPLGETIPDYRSSLEISIRFWYLLLKDMLDDIRKVGGMENKPTGGGGAGSW